MAENSDPIEIQGKTVDDAVQQALRHLRLTRQQVQVEVLTEGRAGVFGIGASGARVRVTPLSRTPGPPAPASEKPLVKIDDYELFEEAPPRDHAAQRDRPARGGARPARGGRGGRGRPRREQEAGGRARAPSPFTLVVRPEEEAGPDPVEHATRVLTDVVHLMGFDAEVTARPPETPMDGLDHAEAVLDVKPANPDDDLSDLVGHRGERLAALQYIINTIISRQYEDARPLTVDVQGLQAPARGDAQRAGPAHGGAGPEFSRARHPRTDAPRGAPPHPPRARRGAPYPHRVQRRG